MSKPVIYLDVDGVLNALDPTEYAYGRHAWGDFLNYPDVRPWDDFDESFDLYMSKNMVAAIAELPADVMWLTTWEHAAAIKVAPLVDAPEWPVLEWILSKGEALARDQKSNPRPFVWVDDQMASKGELVYHMGGEPDVPYLLVKPDALQGLTRNHIAKIAGFINEVSE